MTVIIGVIAGIIIVALLALCGLGFWNYRRLYYDYKDLSYRYDTMAEERDAFEREVSNLGVAMGRSEMKIIEMNRMVRDFRQRLTAQHREIADADLACVWCGVGCEDYPALADHEEACGG